MAISTPDAVPGEVIQAAWGDAVRADLQTLDAYKAGVDTANTFTGANQFAGQTFVGPTAGAGNPGIDKAGVWQNPTGLVYIRGETSATGSVRMVHSSASDVTGGTFAEFARYSSVIGSITQLAGGGTVAYNTGSDPRLKHRDGPIGDALARAATLGRSAFRGRWVDVETGEPVDGECDLVTAPDVAAVAGYAVTGEPGAVDDAGNPVYQQVAYPSLVPLLFAALADAADRIDALEAQIAGP